MEILLVVAYSAFFLFMIGKLQFFRISGLPVRYIKTGFLIKVLAGICLGLIYTYYYTDRLTADTFKFFDDSKIMFDAIYSEPTNFLRMITGIQGGSVHLDKYYNTMTNWYDTFSPFNDNRTMIRFNALVRFFSMGYYNVHVVFICFLALTGLVGIVKVFANEFRHLTLEFYLILLLLPSVLFWGSGLLKDSLVFFSFGITLTVFYRFLSAGRLTVLPALLLILSMAFLMVSKFQVFMLVPPLMAAWFVSARFNVKPWLSFPGFVIFYYGVLLVSGGGGSDNNLLVLLVEKQTAFFRLAEAANAGSVIKIPVLEPTLISLLSNIPSAFVNTLLRPNITDTSPVLTLVSGIENSLILIFGIICLLKFNNRALSGKIVPWFCLFYTLTYFTLIGLLTPILGAMVRYKAQALPFLVIMFVILSTSGDKSILSQLLSKFKRT